METNNTKFANNEHNKGFLHSVKLEVENGEEEEEKYTVKQEADEITPNGDCKTFLKGFIKDEIIEIEDNDLATESESETEIYDVENNIDCYELFIDTEEQEEPPNEKRFMCSQCPKGFIIKEYLDRHTAVHAAEKRYQCKSCAEYFSGEKTFLKHALKHKLTRDEVCMTKRERICRLLDASEITGE